MTSLSAIHSVSIFPSVGVARVGNSPEDYFFGPEVPGPHPADDGKFRDAAGRIKRQAARFKVFGCDANGDVICELTPDDAKIDWTVHVANKKAAWFRFDQALDIPASKGEIPGTPAIASVLRNPDITGADRRHLTIDPGARSITGADTNLSGGAAEYAFDTGKFFEREVYLGELRTDCDGNLIFLGGFGHSGYMDPDAPNPPVDGFANNPGWHDDTSDGPVDAVVHLNDGRTLQAKGAWVLTAPPNYAPGVEAFITGYDQLLQVATQMDPAWDAAQIGFYAHIFPILERLSANQWVNAGLARDKGWGSPSDFSRPDLLAKLSDPSDASRALRMSVFSTFRNPDYKVMETNAMPPVYGDAVLFDINSSDPREWMAMLPIQYEWLRRWSVGDFILDAPRKPDADASAPRQAAGLTEAALAETTGGPYHPGCEFTWPMRVALMYAEPFRIKRRSGPEPDYPAELTSSIALAPGGPLDGSGPGDVTRWMACPWQTDTSSCLSGYRIYSGEYLPTFWPARVPNDVLSEDDYAVVMDASASVDVREAAFAFTRRKKWLRDIVYTDARPPVVIRSPNPRAEFISEWPEVGIVVEQDGPKDTALFPDRIWVETGRSLESEDHEEPAQSVFAMTSPISQR